MSPREKSPGPIPKEALAFFAAKGLKPSFNYQEVWREEHNTAFTVAKVMETDILTTVQDSLTQALEQGIPFDQWQRDIRKVLDQSGWTEYNTDRSTLNRLRIIYQTNMRTARAVGQWERIEKTIKSLPYLLYQLGPSQVHRPEHEEWNGLVIRADDGFWDYAMPPNGYGCKCHVMQVGQKYADRYGVWDVPTAEEIVANIQEGFDYNPGKQTLRAKALLDQGKESLAKNQLSLKDLESKL